MVTTNRGMAVSDRTVSNRTLIATFYPEANVGGFSHVDGTVAFYTQISAVLRATDRVLDFGAGRGELLQDDEIEYRRRISNLKGRCARLDGCDVDEVVLQNPFLDHAKVVVPGRALPYADETFDIVIARSVFEHIDDPYGTAGELVRVVKSGGLIAAVTPNRYGYIALTASLVPNRLHVRALRAIQPERRAHDVFPTRYLMNTPRALHRAFGDEVDIFISRVESEPAYHFGRKAVFRFVKMVNKHLPDSLRPTMFVFIRKH